MGRPVALTRRKGHTVLRLPTLMHHAADTRHDYTTQSHIILTPGQPVLVLSSNAEHLSRKQPVPILMPLVWRGWGSNPRPIDFEANALSTRPLCWSKENCHPVDIIVKLSYYRGTHIFFTKIIHPSQSGLFVNCMTHRLMSDFGSEECEGSGTLI